MNTNEIHPQEEEMSHPVTTTSTPRTPGTPRRPASNPWPYVGVGAALLAAAPLGPILITFVVAPVVVLLAMCLPSTHRLPVAVRVVTYLLAAAALGWVLIVAGFYLSMSTGGHIG